MRLHRSRFSRLIVLSIALAAAAFAIRTRADETALDRYIAKPDPSYH